MRTRALLLATIVAGSCSTQAPSGSPPAATPKQAEAKQAPAAAEPVATSPEATPTATEKDKPMPTDGPVLDHVVKTLDGKDESLADYRGKALLLVNTASECGFTPQYADLQEVYAKYRERGFEVLAFPSNDHGGQEPGDQQTIREFVDKEFSVEFAMFDKVHTTGPEKSPLYKTLTEDTPDGIRGDVKWNFTKFLVDPQGRVVARFEPRVSPTDPTVAAAIEKVLPSKG